MERIKTGVLGLDELMEGGIPEKDLILLSGVCGSGKTIFSLQFLCSKKSKEPGIYVSFEEELPQIKSTASRFGWDAEKLEEEDRIKFLKYDPFKLEDIFEVIENNIRKMKAKRVVIDSISSLGIYVKDTADLRRMILQMSNMLRKNDCTSIIISEIMSGKESLSRFGVEEFVSDGVILLHNLLIAGEYRRGISIWKMRATNHSRKIHPYKITDRGIVIYPTDTFTMR